MTSDPHAEISAKKKKEKNTSCTQVSSLRKHADHTLSMIRIRHPQGTASFPHETGKSTVADLGAFLATLAVAPQASGGSAVFEHIDGELLVRLDTFSNSFGQNSTLCKQGQICSLYCREERSSLVSEARATALAAWHALVV